MRTENQGHTMRKIALPVIALGTFAVLALAAAPASAQATRTWVSGVGDDANPCSRTAPCKTFAGAISKTAAGGEISALDPGGFGAVTITKSITINGDGTLAGILASLVNGVIVNAGVNDKVVLRNLSINGAGNGLNGVRFLAGGQLSIDKCSIVGFTGHAIDVAKAANGELYVTDTYITNVANGIRMTTTGGSIIGAINNTTIVNPTTNGVDAASASIFISLVNSTIAGAATGVTTSVGASTINVTGSTVSSNGTGVNAVANGSTIRIVNNRIFNNTTDLAFTAGATLASNTSNATGPNSGAVPNGTITMR
jgi:hypothetical protein